MSSIVFMVSLFWIWFLLRNANHIRLGLTTHLQEFLHA